LDDGGFIPTGHSFAFFAAVLLLAGPFMEYIGGPATPLTSQ